MDLSGQEQFWPNNINFLRGLDGVFLVYDVTNKKSFDDLSNYLSKTKDYLNYCGIIRILIGNKSDMNDKRVISFKQGLVFASVHGFKYIETSAKENININEILEIFKKEILILYNDYKERNRDITPLTAKK